MKSRITILFLLIAFVANAQHNYYSNQPMFGLGIGYNLVSVIDDDVKPVELSLRFKINNNNLLQLYIPFLKQNDTFKSIHNPSIDLINTSLSTKKRLYGVGMDYDYALRSYSSLYFVMGLRAEFNLYKHRTHLTNTTSASSNKSSEHTYRKKEVSNYIISPNAGFRLNLNRFTVDAKFLLSMLSKRGDVDNSIDVQSVAITPKYEKWSSSISNSFKLKPGVVMSVGYYF